MVHVPAYQDNCTKSRHGYTLRGRLSHKNAVEKGLTLSNLFHCNEDANELGLALVAGLDALVEPLGGLGNGSDTVRLAFPNANH